jgi:DNA repair protein RadC
MSCPQYLTSTSPLRALAPLERPRERLLVLGPAALSDSELVALVLGGGHALRRAELLLRTLGGLGGLVAALPQELAALPGIGDASAAALCAAVELARRQARLAVPYEAALANPEAVHRFAQATLRGASQEIFLVIGLDSRQRVRLVREVGRGTVASVQVHPREVFRPLVRAGAHASILVHNHPSGDVEPSNADLELTARMVDVGWTLGIPVLDHVIVSDHDPRFAAGDGPDAAPPPEA